MLVYSIRFFLSMRKTLYIASNLILTILLPQLMLILFFVVSVKNTLSQDPYQLHKMAKKKYGLLLKSL